MATILKQGMTLTVGRDFVDAAELATPVSKGTLTTGSGAEFEWQSSLPIAESERLLRLAAAEDGIHIIKFVSQAS